MHRTLILVGIVTVFSCTVPGTWAEDRVVDMDGYCFLEGETNHSGTKILFEALTPSAQTDSTYTVETGYFLLGLAEGMYGVHYSHDGFIPFDLPDPIFVPGDTLPDVTLHPGSVLEISGDVSGDGVVDAWDCTYLARAIAGIPGYNL